MQSFSSAVSEPRPAAQPATSPLQQAGAYAIILDAEGRLLTVSANGRNYLPGGRIEVGESPRRALAREIAEECGWSADVLERLWQARQMILGGSVHLRASYWRARLVSPLASPPEHDLVWMSLTQAAASLHRAGDRRAVLLAA